jgi:TolA-binding protein
MRGAFAFLLLLLSAAPAAAQIESREGIALQNQILQLRNQLEELRRAGGGAVAAPRPSGPAPTGGQSEIVAQLLSRVAQLEEEVRRQRGRADEAENRLRQQEEATNKLREDTDFRLQQMEGGRPGARPPAAPATPPRPAAGAAPAAAPAATAPRTPEQALAAGRAALERGDFSGAEAAAREVLAVRNSPRAQDAQLLRAQALAGRRDNQAAAIAFDDAYRANRTSPRAADALLGRATSFQALGLTREACETLRQVRSEFANLTPAQRQAADAAARRANCT